MTLCRYLSGEEDAEEHALELCKNWIGKRPGRCRDQSTDRKTPLHTRRQPTPIPSALALLHNHLIDQEPLTQSLVFPLTKNHVKFFGYIRCDAERGGNS